MFEILLLLIFWLILCKSDVKILYVVNMFNKNIVGIILSNNFRKLSIYMFFWNFYNVIIVEIYISLFIV